MLGAVHQQSRLEKIKKVMAVQVLLRLFEEFHACSGEVHMQVFSRRKGPTYS